MSALPCYLLNVSFCQFSNLPQKSFYIDCNLKIKILFKIFKFRLSVLTRILVSILLSFIARISSLRKMRSDQVSRLVCVEGIVISCSKVSTKATKLALSCRNCKTVVKIPVSLFLNFYLHFSFVMGFLALESLEFAVI